MLIDSDVLIPVYTEAGPMNVLKACISGWPWILRSPRNTYEWCTYYREETADRLASAGVNFVVAGWSCGFSLKADAIQHDQVTAFTAACHKRNVQVGFYVSWNGLFWENMFEDEPRSKDWIRVDHDGTPMRYFRRPERYMGCVNHPGWWAYLKRKVGLGLKAGADAIFFDNTGTTCYCVHCRRLFRAYAKKRFGRASEMPRMDLDAVAAGRPRGKAVDYETIAYQNILSNTAAKASRDLLARIQFDNDRKCDRFREMAAFIKRRKKSATMSANVHEQICANNYLDWFSSETASMPGIEGGTLFTNIALCKVMTGTGWNRKAAVSLLGMKSRIQRMRDKGTGYITGITPADEKLGMAEGYALGVQACSHQAREFIHAGYNRFLLDHADCFAGAVPVAATAVVFDENFARLAMETPNNIAAQLVGAGVLFDMVPVDQVSAKRLAGYDLVVCSNLIDFPERRVPALQAFVARGGTVIVAGPFAEVDEKLLKRRRKPTRLGSSGRGRVIRYERSLARDNPFAMGKPAAAIPKPVLNRIRKAVGPGLEIRPSGRVIGHLLRKRDGKGAVLHLLNYSVKRTGPVRVRMDASRLGFAPKRLRLISPDGGGRRALEFGSENGALSFAVPCIEVYSAVEIG